MTASRGLAALALATVVSLAVAADPPASPRAEEALALCLRTDRMQGDEKRAGLERALALAEETVAADERDPRAHFALFCTLGKQVQLRGVGIGSLLAVRRLRREIDRAIELAPEWPEPLLGKGSFLIALPRFLGGDVDGGERLLRKAIEIDPSYLEPRLRLARALAARGARQEARDQARQALALAERKSDAEGMAEARTLLGRIEH